MTGVRIPGGAAGKTIRPDGFFMPFWNGCSVTICYNKLVDKGAGIWDNTLLNWAESMRRNDRKTRRMVLCSCSEFEIIAL